MKVSWQIILVQQYCISNWIVSLSKDISINIENFNLHRSFVTLLLPIKCICSHFNFHLDIQWRHYNINNTSLTTYFIKIANWISKCSHIIVKFCTCICIKLVLFKYNVCTRLSYILYDNFQQTRNTYIIHLVICTHRKHHKRQITATSHMITLKLSYNLAHKFYIRKLCTHVGY